MADHGARDHARWSASATARNWACPGSLFLSEAYPDKESEAAAWGTACHQVAEKALRGAVSAASFIDTVEKTKQHEFEVDDEMAETAQAYVDYVQSVSELVYPDLTRAASDAGDRSLTTALFVEQKFSLAALSPPFEAGGTADAVVHNARERRLEVIDLKGGRGVVVEAKGNPQLRTYALGAMLANPGLAIDTVTVTIVQPRAPHKDGRIRSETFHVADLVEWTTDLLAAMHRAARAVADAEKVDKTITMATWAAEHLSAGTHCKFCKAAGACPALEQQVMDTAGVWFDDLDRPTIANTPDSRSPEQLSAILDLADMIEDWISAVRAYAHRLAESGVAIPEYILVDKEGRRAWAADEAKVVADLKAVVGLTDDQIFARKLLSPAQIEKALGAKRKSEIANFWHKPAKGTNLVRATKTTRAAAVPAVHQHFNVID